MSYRHFFEDALQQLKTENRYRVFADMEREASRFPRAKLHRDNRSSDAIIWCANDYLGMGRHPAVVAAAT